MGAQGRSHLRLQARIEYDSLSHNHRTILETGRRQNGIPGDGELKESSADLIIRGLKEAGVSVVCALPESHLKPVYVKALEDPDFRYIPVTNEGEGTSIAAGVWLTGQKAVMIMENSGLRMATESLSRLGLTHGIPVVLLMSYRGDLGEPNWWGIPHGITMEPLLNALRIPYVVVRKDEDIVKAITNARRSADTSKYHTAIVFGGEVIEN